MKVVLVAVRFPVAKIIEVIVGRVAPGFVNLVSILLVGRYLSAAEYGAFSITLATTALVAICITGPTRFAIVPRRAVYEAQGKGRDFERGILSLLILSISCLVIVGAILWGLGAVKFIWVALQLDRLSLMDGCPFFRRGCNFGDMVPLLGPGPVQSLYFFTLLWRRNRQRHRPFGPIFRQPGW